MTQAAGSPPVTGRSGGVSWARQGGARPGAGTAPAWLAGIPAVVTLGVGLYGSGQPSLWRDEGATLAAVHRSFPQMLRMLGNVDVVHGAYYVLMWFFVRVAGTGAVALRFPSALAMAVAAAALALLGMRLVSVRAGLAAGFVFAALPLVTRYAQDARSYAMVTALAALASYVLVRAGEGGPHRRRWLIAYGAAIAGVGLGNLLALLIVPAHALTVAAWLWRQRAGGTQQERREARALGYGWLAAVACAGLVVSPVAVIAWGQRGQVNWIKPPTLGTVYGVSGLIGGFPLFVLVMAVMAAGVGVAALGRTAGLRAQWPGRMVALAVPWLIVPPGVLLGLSLMHPYYSMRYIVYCVPPAALLAGTGLAALGRVAGVVALALIVAVAVPEQAHARLPASHGENLLRLSQILAQHEHRGDAVIFEGRNTREFEAAYPAPYRSLHDVGLGEPAARSGTLTGTNAPPAVVRARLASVTRLWAVEIGDQRGNVTVLRGLGFRAVRHWAVTGIWLELFVHPRRAVR